MRRARFAEILRRFAVNEVEFVVVGMTAGILHGAPVTTIDLDVVHRRSPENVARLLRVLGTIDEDRGYEELLAHTVEMRLSDGLAVHVLSLPALIEAKQRAGRAKDLAALPVLRVTLEEIERG